MCSLLIAHCMFHNSRFPSLPSTFLFHLNGCWMLTVGCVLYVLCYSLWGRLLFLFSSNKLKEKCCVHHILPFCRRWTINSLFLRPIIIITWVCGLWFAFYFTFLILIHNIAKHCMFSYCVSVFTNERKTTAVYYWSLRIRLLFAVNFAKWTNEQQCTSHAKIFIWKKNKKKNISFRIGNFFIRATTNKNRIHTMKNQNQHCQKIQNPNINLKHKAALVGDRWFHNINKYKFFGRWNKVYLIIKHRCIWIPNLFMFDFFYFFLFFWHFKFNTEITHITHLFIIILHFRKDCGAFRYFFLYFFSLFCISSIRYLFIWWRFHHLQQIFLINKMTNNALVLVSMVSVLCSILIRKHFYVRYEQQKFNKVVAFNRPLNHTNGPMHQHFYIQSHW